MIHDARDAAIVACTVQLARSLGLAGRRRGRRDRRDQLTALRAMGCDLAQGYSFSRALPAAEFAAWVTNDRATVRSVGAQVIALRA